MTHTITRIACAVLLSASLAAGAHADDAREDSRGTFGVGVAIGTTGLSAEAKFAPSRNIMIRGGYNFLDVDEIEFIIDEGFDDVDYSGSLNFSTFSGFVDIAPFGNGFVLSGGAYLGEKSLDLRAVPTATIQVGGDTFTAAQVGTLDGQVRYNDVAPYAGIGYDSFISGRRNWAFNIRAGVMFTGEPEGELFSAGGTLSNDPTLRAELDAEVQEILADAEDAKYFPVLSLGIARRF